MTRALTIAAAAAIVAGGTGFTLAQNISQSQSGWGNSQSISIGNSDGSKPAAKDTKDTRKSKKKVSSSQSDSSGNTQSVDANGGGNISQNQNGRNNSQSIKIGSGVSGTPSVTQSQSGADKKQSILIDGKKVEKKQE